MVADKVAEGVYVVHRSFGKNAVAEIEDVAGPTGRLAQNIFGTLLQFFPIGEEQHWIKIALHGAFVSRSSSIRYRAEYASRGR